MKVLGRIFLNFHKERRKDGVFFVRCRRTYVLKNTMPFCSILQVIGIQRL